MNQSKTEINDNIDYRDWIHNYVNVYKDWSLTHSDIKRHEIRQVSWSQFTLCEHLKEWDS